MKVATMRNRSLIVASISALLTLAGSAQSIPDAPQPQKKPAPKAQADPTPPPPADDPQPETRPPAKDDNAFPEAVSQAAAKQAAQDSAAPDAPAAKPHPTADDNPFPEAESKAAAKEALPPGVSSSQSSSADVEPAKAPEVVVDPARSRKDTEVGGFYLKSGDLKGALLRYQEASAADPTNINAIFGLAETQRLLGKKDEAARDYQMYLDIVPNGPKAKEAMKALKVLQASK